MASPLFCEGLVEDLHLQPLLGTHLLEPSVLDFELLEPGHNGSIHSATLSQPLVKRRRADAKLRAIRRNRQARLNSLHRI